MAILGEDDRKAILRHFSLISEDVPVNLTHPAEGPGETGAILEELAGLSGRILLTTRESEEAAHPMISVGGHGRVVFWGTPSGYEFSSLLTSIIDAGRPGSRLLPETETFLRELDEDLDIMVFVTPACPHCPGSAVLAHRMAAASDRVTARVIEAQDYPDLARDNNVMGVPRTVINGRFHGEGAISETTLVSALSRALSSSPREGAVNLSEYMP